MDLESLSPGPGVHSLSLYVYIGLDGAVCVFHA
jgi:hypothetical protein